MDFSPSIPNGSLRYLNAEAETMLGRKRDELLGGVLWEKFPELIGSVFETNYERVMAEQSRRWNSRQAMPAGKIWFEVHAYPSNGGVSVFFRDISERKRTESERLTTSKLESLGTLAGGIAHDLNNILTVISGNIGLAQIEAPADAGSLLGFLSKAGQAAQHAAHLSSQLLTFSKGGAPLKKVVSIGELLERSAEFSLYGSNLRADFDIAVDLWKAEVDAGPDRAGGERVDAQCARSDAAWRDCPRSRAQRRLGRQANALLPAGPLHQDHASPTAAPVSPTSCAAKFSIPISRRNRPGPAWAWPSVIRS